jgi:hypothetical protein
MSATRTAGGCKLRQGRPPLTCSAVTSTWTTASGGRAHDHGGGCGGDSGQFLDRQWEDKSLSEIFNAPVSALQGVSEGDAEALRAAFNGRPHLGLSSAHTEGFNRRLPLPAT